MPERENGVLETPLGRLHVKRYLTASGGREAQAEVDAATLLSERGVPAIKFAAWGELPDGRAFTATEELAGHVSGQVFLREGGTFREILRPTAALAARLHGAGLHHRDLYLCHFFYRPSDGDCRLIDIARVAALPRFFARRWVVKDLAQFAYSMREFALGAEEFREWLDEYGRARGTSTAGLQAAVRAKADAIARHDRRLRAKQPNRNVSIPG